MKERPITMILAWASLSVAAKHLKDLQLDDETVNSLLLELETAANLTEAFNRVWRSIHWNSSRKATKVRVTRTLRKMAEMIFDHLEESVRLFDQLCDEQSRFQTIPLTDDWLKIRNCLERGKKEFDRTQGKFIEPLPLMKYLKEQENN
ncbi:hypothetical protein [Crocosphaera chwakensis]|uniref:Uncharacterized protein n=1 Tax=Crocosphaera chwakensis CCY0110 TaxID=391612 RepID=A3ITV8_9CHRO|nr:hypothetical protein [Crocosphaera chwakensis]EAZ90053.1 hypothetical protein CY0110_14945 [Crocosphaera chwakensis CCY0110]